MRSLLLVLCLVTPTLAHDGHTVWRHDQEVSPFNDLNGFGILAFPAPIENLHCDPRVIEAFNQAWELVGNGRRDYEAGFRVDKVGEDIEIHFAEMTYEPYTLAIQVVHGKTVAIAHTHPNDAYAQPLGADLLSPVPNYVISKNALYVTDPVTQNYERLRRRSWRRACD